MNGHDLVLQITPQMLQVLSPRWMEQVSLYLLVACGTTCFLLFAGTWTKNVFTNGDILRLHLACEVMEIDARQSIFYAAQNAFGKNRIHTNMYVVYMFCFLCVTVLLNPMCVGTTSTGVSEHSCMHKMISNKKSVWRLHFCRSESVC